MYETLRAYITSRGCVTEDELAFVESLYVPRTLEKGEFFQRAGEITKCGFFVVRGCLRTYQIDAKGKDHILEFSPENWFGGDLQSAVTNTPSVYFVDAIERTDVLTIDLPSFRKMLEQVPEIARQYQRGLERGQAARARRIASSLLLSSRERYLEFLEIYPTLSLRIPQHMLASYLGMTPETLSRIRATIK